MISSQKRREGIFDLYSQNLNYVKDFYQLRLPGSDENGEKEITEPMYFCPLCFWGYSKEALDQNTSNPLTLEDVPPKSVGGKPILLTCKRCNNQAGQKHDKIIHDLIIADSFIKRTPNSTIKGFATFPDGLKLSAEIITPEKNKNVIHLQYKPSSYVDEKIKSFFAKGGEKTINYSFPLPTKKSTDPAFIRIGLLFAFYYFGHRVLFEDNYRKIHNILNQPENNSFPFGGILNMPLKTDAIPGIHILTKPESYRSYLIVFDILYNKATSKRIGFFFPGPGKTGWEHYDNLRNAQGDIQFTFKNITSREFISKKEFANAYDYLFVKL